MKKYLVFFLITALLACLAACGQGAEEPEVIYFDKGTIYSPSNGEEHSLPDLWPEVESRRKTFLELFVEGVKEAGFATAEITQLSEEELSGAMEAFRFKIEEGYVTLYYFDDHSDIYKSILESKELVIDGAGTVPVEVVNSIAMYLDGICNREMFIQMFHEKYDSGDFVN